MAEDPTWTRVEYPDGAGSVMSDIHSTLHGALVSRRLCVRETRRKHSTRTAHTTKPLARTSLVPCHLQMHPMTNGESVGGHTRGWYGSTRRQAASTNEAQESTGTCAWGWKRSSNLETPTGHNGYHEHDPGRNRNQTKGRRRARKRERSNRQKGRRTYRLRISAQETQVSFVIQVDKACALDDMEQFLVAFVTAKSSFNCVLVIIYMQMY